jgi:hypothetical protein
LVSFTTVGGILLVESHRSEKIARTRRAAESRELDAHFVEEVPRIETRLEELKTEAIRAIPFADRRRLPAGVVSASVWARSGNGITRTSGLEAEGVWEQALYRVLPAEVARRKTLAVLPLGGPGEILRLALFPEPDGIHTAAIAFRPSVLFDGHPMIDGMRRALIAENGLVLAHTNSSEIGARKRARAELYLRHERESPHRAGVHRLASRSWEGYPSTILFSRLPGWNAFFVMEKVHAPVKATLSPLWILILIAGSLLGILFLGLAGMRPPAPQAASEKSETPEALEAKLVASLSEATRSPVFFFRYESFQGIARLTAEAGYPTARLMGGGGMSFALDRHRGARNFGDYPPLFRLMRMRLGIANFEAWPIVEARPRGSGPSPLLGILVVARTSLPPLCSSERLIARNLEAWIPSRRIVIG